MALTPSLSTRKERKRRFLPFLVPVLLLAQAVGCRSLTSDHPITVLVRDAETREPIPNAEVRLSDPLTPPTRAGAEPNGQTGADGKIILGRGKLEHRGATIETKAPGYFFAVQDLSAVPDSDEPLSGTKMRVVPQVDVLLYAEPRPTVELIIPNGFRGLIKAEKILHESQPGDVVGERAFVFAVNPAGVAEMNGSMILRHALAQDYKARYASGSPLRGDVPANEVGLRWVRTGGHTEYFVIGTKEELDEARQNLENADAEPVAPGTKPSGGGGHRGGGGARRGGGGGMR